MAWNICSSGLLVAACPALIRLNDKTKTARTITLSNLFMLSPTFLASPRFNKLELAPALRRAGPQAGWYTPPQGEGHGGNQVQIPPGPDHHDAYRLPGFRGAVARNGGP